LIKLFTLPFRGSEIKSDTNSFFSFVTKDNVKFLSVILQKEHPQIIALVLANMPSYYSSMVIKSMQSEMRSDVILRISLLKEIELNTIKAIEAIIEKKLNSQSYYYQTEPCLNIALRMLKYLNNKLKKQIADSLKDRNAVVADVIKRGKLCRTEL